MKEGIQDTKEDGLILQKITNVQMIKNYNTKDGNKRQILSVMYKRMSLLRYNREIDMPKYNKRKKKLHGLQLLFCVHE